MNYTLFYDIVNESDTRLIWIINTRVNDYFKRKCTPTYNFLFDTNHDFIQGSSLYTQNCRQFFQLVKDIS